MGEFFSEIRSQLWKKVAAWQVVAASLGFAILFYLLKTDDDGFLSIIDEGSVCHRGLLLLPFTRESFAPFLLFCSSKRHSQSIRVK